MRLLVILVAAALFGPLAACGPMDVMAAGEEGDCYEVVGKDTLGAPKLKKVACADEAPGVAEAPVPIIPEARAIATPATAACPAAPVCCQPAACEPVKVAAVSRKPAPKLRKAARKVVRTGRTRYEYGSPCEYGTPYDYGCGGYPSQPLLGAAPLPPVQYGGEIEESRRKSYARRDEVRTPPPPLVREHRYESRERSAFSSSSSSSKDSRQSDCCCCDDRARGAASQGYLDARGYLTWPGKVPAR